MQIVKENRALKLKLSDNENDLIKEKQTIQKLKSQVNEKIVEKKCEGKVEKETQA